MTDSQKLTAYNSLTVDQQRGISSTEWNGVVMHTTWFVLYLAADVFYSVLYYNHISAIRNTRFWPIVEHIRGTWRDTKAWYPTWEWGIYLLQMLGVGSYVIKLSIFLYAYNGSDRNAVVDNPSTFVQLLSKYFNDFAKPAFWFFIIMATNARRWPSA